MDHVNFVQNRPDALPYTEAQASFWIIENMIIRFYKTCGVHAAWVLL